MALINLGSTPPASLGVRNGKLSPCAEDSNCCVCSQFKSSETVLGPHYVQPLRFEGDCGDAMTRLIAVLMAERGCTIVTSGRDYIHAEFSFKTLGVGMTDDVEFLLDAEKFVIHVRSSSRLGFTDLGNNRARVNHLREAFDEADE